MEQSYVWVHLHGLDYEGWLGVTAVFSSEKHAVEYAHNFTKTQRYHDTTVLKVAVSTEYPQEISGDADHEEIYYHNWNHEKYGQHSCPDNTCTLNSAQPNSSV